MSVNRESVLNIVNETLRELGEDLDKPDLLEIDESTRLFGARSALDSMSLVNVIAEVEEKLSDEHGIEIALADQSAMSQTLSPFRRVSTFVDYILERIAAEG